MKNVMRALALVLSLVMLLGVFAGCTPTDPDNSTGSNNSATGGNATPGTDVSETGTLKLHWYQGIGINTVFEDPWIDQQSLYPWMVFDALVAYEPQNNRLVGRLATEWTESEDGLTYTFTIRENVKWHDGEPFTAEDVVFTFNAEVANPQCNFRVNISNIEGYQDVVDGKTDKLAGVTAEGNTVTIKLSAKKATFVHGLRTLMILPEHLLKDVEPAKISNYEAYWSKPVGTGAYKMNTVNFPDNFTLVRNDEYWDAKAGIKNVQFTNYTAGGNDAIVNAMIAGELDYVFGNATNDMAVANNVVEQNKDVKTLLISGGGTIRFFGFNLNRPNGEQNEDLKKVEVRRAFDMLFDKNGIASFYNGQSVALSTFVNPNAPVYNDDIPLPKYQPDEAKKMLQDAGYDFSKTIIIGYYYDDQTTKEVMSYITQCFGDVGIKVETVFLADNAAQEEGHYDILYAGASHWLPAGCYGQYAGNANTMLGIEGRDEIFTDLAVSYFSTGDSAELERIAKELQALDYQHRYLIPVYQLQTVQMYNGAHVDFPDDIFSMSNCTNYRWNEWKLLG